MIHLALKDGRLHQDIALMLDINARPQLARIAHGRRAVEIMHSARGRPLVRVGGTVLGRKSCQAQSPLYTSASMATRPLAAMGRPML